MPKRKTKKRPTSIPGVIIRMPIDLQEWLRKQAAAEARTMTEIIKRSLNAERSKIEHQQEA